MEEYYTLIRLAVDSSLFFIFQNWAFFFATG